MNDASTVEEKEINKKAISLSRAKLLGLMALYSAPLLLAWAWYAYVSANEGAGVSVNGELIHPAVPLEAFELETAGKTAEEQALWGLDDIRGKWSMVYFAGDQCDELCETTLYNMRQIRLSMGRRMTRLQRILVTPQWRAMQQKFESASEGLLVVGGGSDKLLTLRSQFDKAQSQLDNCKDCMYLVDPNGNLMMRFSPDLEPKKVLKDIKHLLKVSRIG